MNKLQKWSHIMLKSAWKRMRSVIKGSISYSVWCKCLFTSYLQTKIGGKFKIKFLKYEQTTKVKSLFVTIWMKKNFLCHKRSILHTVWCKCLLTSYLQPKIGGKFKIKFLRCVQTTKVKSHFVTICMKKNALCHKRKHFVYSST